MQLNAQSLRRHIYVLGGTGVGKSRALESWIMQLIRQGEGVGIIDPHGELFYDILTRIAKTGDRRLWQRVVIVNPLDATHIVGFNPLEVKPGEVVERKAQFLADVINKIWKADPLITARMQRMMQHTFWLLAATGLTLVELPQVLLDPEFRGHLLKQVPKPNPLHLYWEQEFPTAPRMVVDWTQSTLNKAGTLTTDPVLRLLFGQQRSSFDMRQIMDKGLVLLVNLSKGVLGADNSHMLGGFLMGAIQQAALARADAPAVSYRSFTLFVDEFQNYTTDNIQEILAESRKYKLSLVMAHQYYGQLRDNPKLQAAVVNTVGNLVCFRLGYSDADLFVRDVFYPSLDQVKDVRVNWQRVPSLLGERLEAYEQIQYRQLEEIWERETRRLTMLKNREFWYKQRGPYQPRLLRSSDMPDIKLTPRLQEAITELVALSNRRWARSQTEVQREVERRQHHLMNPPASDDDDNIWSE